MKKYLFILLTIFATMSCNKDVDEMINDGSNIKDELKPTEPLSFVIEGRWATEAGDEEIVYNQTGGRFYSIFCTSDLSGSLDGTYQLSGSSKVGYELNWRYTYLTTNVSTDFKILNYSQNSFTTKNDISTTKYFRVKKVIDLDAGGSAPFEENTTNLTIFDERMFTLSNNRIISTGMKGYTYIKVNDSSDPYYIKVAVGTSSRFYDLWYDYSSLLNASTQTVENKLGAPSGWGTGSDGTEQCGYLNMRTTHSQVYQVNFLFNKDRKVEQIHINLKEGTAQTQILSFLNERFHENIVDGDAHYYTSLPFNDENIGSQNMFIVIYDTSKGLVVYMPYVKVVSLWENPYQFFGLTKEEAKARFKSYELTIDEEGVLQYNVNDEESNLSVISPRFYGPDNTMSSMLILYKDKLTAKEVDDFIAQSCTYQKSEVRSNGYSYNTYYSNDYSYGVLHNVSTRIVTYYDMYWPDYSPLLNQTKDDLVNAISNIRDMEDYLVMIPINNFIKRIILTLKDGKCAMVTATLEDGVESQMVINYFNNLYIFSRSTDEGANYIWFDAPSATTANSMIMYTPEKNSFSMISTNN